MSSTTIEIPRLENEHAKRYAARVAYLTLGPTRSLAAVAAQQQKALTLIERWSTQDCWVEHARRYDDAVAGLAAQQASQDYLNELKRHQKAARDLGTALVAVAAEMLQELRNNKKKLEYTPGALSVIARAGTIGLDMRAHALQLDELLPRLSNDDDND